MSVVTRIRTSQELTVAFTREEVWGVLADVAAYPDWWPAKLGVEILHDPEGLLGAELEVRPVMGRMFRIRFEELEGRRTMRLRFFGGSLEGPGAFHLESRDGATHVRYEMDVFVRGLDVAVLSQVLPFHWIHASRMRSVLRGLAGRLKTLRKAADREAAQAARLAERESASRLVQEEAGRRVAEEQARRRAQEEAARRAAEEEAKRRAEAEAMARAAAEEAERRAAEEEAKKRAEEAAAARAAAEEGEREEEAAARAAAEEAERQVAEEEAALRAAEEEAKRRAEEEAAARAAAEEAERRVAEEEAALRAAEEEAKRRAEEEAAARAAAEEAERRAAEEAAARAAAEEAERRAAEEEATRRAAEEEAKKRAEEEAAARAAAEEAERRAAEEAAARAAAEEAERRAAEEEATRRAAEEEAKKRAEEEAAARAAAAEVDRRAEEERARRRAEEAVAARTLTGSQVRALWGRIRQWLTETPAVAAPSPPVPELPDEPPSNAPASNFEMARTYLDALSSPSTAEEIASYFAPEAVQEEFPHRFLPSAATRGFPEIREARARALTRFESQRYDLAGATGGGSQVAMEVRFKGSVATTGERDTEGQDLDARLAIFLKFAGGKIMRERTYACFEPWSTQAERMTMLDERVTQAGQSTMASPMVAEGVRPPIRGSNFEIAQGYLEALSSGADAETIARYYATDAVQDEFPNRLLPGGAHRSLQAIRLARSRGLALFASENYELVGATGGGSMVALEVEWSGVVGEGPGLFTPGQKLEARLAIFLKFRDGLIVGQRNYNCA